MWDVRACSLCQAGSGAQNGSLGPILGPYGIDSSGEPIHVHRQCALWSGRVAEARDGSLLNVPDEVARGRHMACTHCGKRGATVGCRVAACRCNYHLPCAAAAGAAFNARKFQIACSAHAHMYAYEEGAAAAAAGGPPAAPTMSRAQVQRLAESWQHLEDERRALRARSAAADAYDAGLGTSSGSDSGGGGREQAGPSAAGAKARPAKRPRLAPEEAAAIYRHVAVGAAAAEAAFEMQRQGAIFL